MNKADMRRYPAMEIAISGLSDGEYPFSFDVPAEKIGLDDSFIESVRVDGTLRKVSTQFFINGRIQTSYRKECDRCLVMTRRDIDIPLNIYYQSSDGRKPTEEEGEVMTLEPDQESIVLDEDVRQTVTIEMPLKFLCSEACLGICPGCGVDLNKERCRCEGAEIDPRWAKLADLLKKDPDQE